MKQLFALLLTCCCVHHAMAQKFRMVDTTNTWVVYEFYGMIGEQKTYISLLHLGSDTLINGKNYKRMLAVSWRDSVSKAGSNYFGTYYREDTVNNRVYCINTATSDTTEQLIFDYNWSIGDSIAWKRNNSPDSGYNIILGIDSILINAAWYRIFHIDGYNAAFSNVHGQYEVIEGIGPTSAPGFCTFPTTFENGVYLRCFFHAGMQPPITPQVGGFGNVGCYLDVEQTARLADAIHVVPNPANHDAMLYVPAAAFDKCIMVNALGQRVATIDISGKTRVSIGPYLQASGIYLVVLTNASGQRVVRKFVFEN